MKKPTRISATLLATALVISNVAGAQTALDQTWAPDSSSQAAGNPYIAGISPGSMGDAINGTDPGSMAAASNDSLLNSGGAGMSSVTGSPNNNTGNPILDQLGINSNSQNQQAAASGNGAIDTNGLMTTQPPPTGSSDPCAQLPALQQQALAKNMGYANAIGTPSQAMNAMGVNSILQRQVDVAGIGGMSAGAFGMNNILSMAENAAQNYIQQSVGSVLSSIGVPSAFRGAISSTIGSAYSGLVQGGSTGMMSNISNTAPGAVSGATSAYVGQQVGQAVQGSGVPGQLGGVIAGGAASAAGAAAGSATSNTISVMR